MALKNIAFITVAAAALLSTTATAETLVFGVLIKSLSQPFWASVENGISATTESAQVDYYLQTMESNQPTELQLNTCNTMLQRKPNVMIAAGIDPVALLPCFEKANELNIPVITLSDEQSTIAANAKAKEIAFSIESNHANIGEQSAEFVTDQLGNEATGTVLVLEAKTGKIDQQRTNGFTNRLAKTAPKMEIVTFNAPNGSREEAETIVNDIVGIQPNLKVIFAANDHMALGATNATMAMGKGEDIIVIGVNGNSYAVDSINKNELHATVARFPYLMGKVAVEKASELLAGTPIDKPVLIPSMVITKDILASGTDSLLDYIK